MGEAFRSGIDGKVMAPAEATISVLDDGLLRGDGVFEAIKLYDGHPFRLAAHLDRLERSAAALHLGIDRGSLEREIAELLADVEEEAMLRVVVTREGRRILLVERLPEWPPTARIALVELSPNEILAGVKSISYAANMHATRLAAGRGADEAVFVSSAGLVLEAPTSSVFWIDAAGTLRTPSLGCGILDSITRHVLLEALEVEEGEYAAADLRDAEAAFLASTTREVQPISAVDGRELPGTGGDGVVEAARRVLLEAVARERSG